jgi:hypothetical protein
MNRSNTNRGISIAIFLIAFFISILGFFIEFTLFSSRIWQTFPLIPKPSSPSAPYDNTCQLLDKIASVGVIISAIIPGLGGLITAAIVIQNTNPQDCAKNKVAFVHTAMDPKSKLQIVWEKILKQNRIDLKGNWSETLFFEKWMNDRCDRPHIVFLAFTIVFSVTTGIVILILLIACCVVGPLICFFWIGSKS